MRADELGGFGDVGERVGGAEPFGHLPLERDRIDGDDGGGSGDGRALHGVDADAADPHDDDVVARRVPRPR